MISPNTMSDEEFERHALEILGRELGPDGVARFVRLSMSGHGDYTNDRARWQTGATVEDIVRSIETRKRHEP